MSANKKRGAVPVVAPGLCFIFTPFTEKELAVLNKWSKRRFNTWKKRHINPKSLK